MNLYTPRVAMQNCRVVGRGGLLPDRKLQERHKGVRDGCHSFRQGCGLKCEAKNAIRGE
jgi:hypothetical protein